MAGGTVERAGHESLDAESRRRKAEKIQAILEAERTLAGASLLEIGVGSGLIASHFRDVVGPEGDVRGVDVRDSRLVRDFEFELVEGTRLPFADGTFDVVVSNHVVEHVGSRGDQLDHLREIARVLTPGGVAYLATPSRWTLVEPHFHLPLLSWVPRAARSPYVRLARRGTEYDCDLLSRSQLLDLASAAGLEARERTLEAMRLLGTIESRSLARRVAAAPDAVHRALLPLVPTLVFVLRRREGDPAA